MFAGSCFLPPMTTQVSGLKMFQLWKFLVLCSLLSGTLKSVFGNNGSNLNNLDNLNSTSEGESIKIPSASWSQSDPNKCYTCYRRSRLTDKQF